MYKLIGSLNVKSDHYDEIQADFNEETSCFRISFFQNGHFYDEIILNITADEDGVYSDIDKWQMKCLDLSAELFDYEMGHKPNGLFAKLFRRRRNDE